MQAGQASDSTEAPDTADVVKAVAHKFLETMQMENTSQADDHPFWQQITQITGDSNMPMPHPFTLTRSTSALWATAGGTYPAAIPVQAFGCARSM
jgi:hypothetical protein